MTRTDKDKRDRLHRAQVQNEVFHRFMKGLALYSKGNLAGASGHLHAAVTLRSQVQP